MPPAVVACSDLHFLKSAGDALLTNRPRGLIGYWSRCLQLKRKKETQELTCPRIPNYALATSQNIKLSRLSSVLTRSGNPDISYSLYFGIVSQDLGCIAGHMCHRRDSPIPVAGHCSYHRNQEYLRRPSSDYYAPYLCRYTHSLQASSMSLNHGP
jgi:hypothetical protein